MIAVDVTEDKLRLARELGADHVVNAAGGDPVAEIQRLGGADVAIVLAVAPSVFSQSFAALNRGGRMILVSLPADGELTVPIFDTVLKGISIIGSIVGTRQDLIEVFDLHAAGRTTVIAVPRALNTVNEAIDAVLEGTVPARLVFTFEEPLPVDPRPADART